MSDETKNIELEILEKQESKKKESLNVKDSINFKNALKKYSKEIFGLDLSIAQLDFVEEYVRTKGDAIVLQDRQVGMTTLLIMMSLMLIELSDTRILITVPSEAQAKLLYHKFVKYATIANEEHLIRYIPNLNFDINNDSAYVNKYISSYINISENIERDVKITITPLQNAIDFIFTQTWSNMLIVEDYDMIDEHEQYYQLLQDIMYGEQLIYNCEFLNGRIFNGALLTGHCQSYNNYKFTTFEKTFVKTLIVEDSKLHPHIIKYDIPEGFEYHVAEVSYYGPAWLAKHNLLRMMADSISPSPIDFD